jgi:hypothetical protein
MAHGFPFLEPMDAANDNNVDTRLGAFLLNQVFVMNPSLAPVWIAGLLGPLLVACYPTLFVPGGCTIAQWAHRRAAATGAGMAAFVSLVLSPIALPVLPPPLLVAYITRLGIAPQQQERSFCGTVLLQFFADQLG